MTTIVRARYYPATVQIPGEPTPRRRQCVILAQGGDHGGLHTWSAPAAMGEVVLPIDWAGTTIPTGRAARNGVYVTLTDGRIVVVTPAAGCRCGTLGRWPGPYWASAVTTTPK